MKEKCPGAYPRSFDNVVSAKVEITQKVQSYSVYAVNADKLRQFEKYEAEEEERKRMRRKRGGRGEEEEMRTILGIPPHSEFRAPQTCEERSARRGRRRARTSSKFVLIRKHQMRYETCRSRFATSLTIPTAWVRSPDLGR